MSQRERQREREEGEKPEGGHGAPCTRRIHRRWPDTEQHSDDRFLRLGSGSRGRREGETERGCRGKGEERRGGDCCLGGNGGKGDRVLAVPEEERGGRLEVGDASDWWGPFVSGKKRKERKGEGRWARRNSLGWLWAAAPGWPNWTSFLFFCSSFFSFFVFLFSPLSFDERVRFK
jgi:hypothetical protein